MVADNQLNAKTKVGFASFSLLSAHSRSQMVTDYLLLAQSLHQAADSMNAYVAVLASTSTHSDTVSLLIPPPQLPPLSPYSGPGSAHVALPRLGANAHHENSDAEEDDGKGKKRRRSVAGKEKKIKDPNAPKRPASGYIVYQNAVRATVKAQYPDMPAKEIQSKIAEDWKNLDADKKKVCRQDLDTNVVY